MTAIRGIGVWYPETVRTNDEWPDDFALSSRTSKQRVFNDIESPSSPALRVTEDFLQQEATDPFLGVRARRVADDSTSAVDAEAFAATAALQDAELSPSDIDCVISYSAVPDRPTPPAAGGVAARLGITDVLALGMDVACATALVQISTARALIVAKQASNVLLTQSHLALRTFPLLHPASPLLGDASTALVVSASGRWPILACHAVTSGAFHDAVTWVREGAETPWWEAGSAFRMGSRDREALKILQRDTIAFGAQTITEACAGASIDIERLGVLASAQPRGWVPQGILRVLGLPEDIAASVFPDRGHLGASGCIANLEAAYRAGHTAAADVGALYAQGAGFTRAAVLLDLSSDELAVRQGRRSSAPPAA